MQQQQNINFTPEQEVLLWAIRVDNKMDERVADILAAGINWVHLRDSAVQHGIIPLLYRRLKKREIAKLVPPEELLEFQSLFQENIVRNIRMTQHLFSIIDLLADSGIETMPFKGPVLAVQVYGDLSMRSFSDLDILIHADDLSRAYRVLTDHGYFLDDPDRIGVERRLALFDQKDLCFSFKKDILEVHWKIIEKMYAVPLDMNHFWDRSLNISINDKKVRTLSPEDVIIILCFHGLKHSWQNLNGLADLIYAISDSPELRWHDIFVRAENMGLKRILLIGLFLAHKYGGGRFGFESEKQLTLDSTMLQIVSNIEGNLFQSHPIGASNITPFLYLRSRERFKDKIVYLCYFLTVEATTFPSRFRRWFCGKL